MSNKPNVSVEIVGLKQLVKQLKSLEPEMVTELKTMNRELAELVAAEARGLVPVRTGRLRASIRAGATIRSGVTRAGKKALPYAAPVHFGWPARSIAPQPFLYDALDHRRDEVMAAYTAGVNEIVDRIR